MRINLKVRFKNKTFVASFVALIVSFVYSMLNLFGVTPQLEQNAVMTAVNACLTVLGMLGVLVDPTTAGVSDSVRAMGYTDPHKDE